MIEMQYNFPLLPSQGEQWQGRLRQAVETLHPANPAELRPTFRSDKSAHRAIAAHWLGSSPQNTWITCGGHHASLVSLMAAGLAGQTIAVDELTYTGILDQGRMLGCKLIGIAIDAEGMIPESLREACLREATSPTGPIRAIYTMPTVHNPLGCVAGLARRQAIAEAARACDLLILEDDAYGYMQPDPPPSYAILAPERTFYIRGLSKSYAPATHTGFLVAPIRFTAAIELAIKNSSTGTSLVNNIAALSLVADGSIDTVIARKREEGARRNAAARQLLGPSAAPGAPCAWLLWVHLPEGLTPEDAQALCADRGVLVSGGHGFTAPGITAHGLRIALGGELDATRTLEGVRAVADVLLTPSILSS